MALLKKVRASTLMETLVATVLIVIIFMLSSLILNNLFSYTIKSDVSQIETYLNELEYLHETENLQLPYYYDLDEWEVSVEREIQDNKAFIEFEAVNEKMDKKLLRKRFEHN